MLSAARRDLAREARVGKSSTTYPPLATKRLRLRRFEARDLLGLHACFGDEHGMRYWNSPACKTEAETERAG